jgi:hypothetical protein
MTAPNKSPDLCHVCGLEEREPWTHAAASMLRDCLRCGERTCSRCGESDIDWNGHGTVLCVSCGGKP